MKAKLLSFVFISFSESSLFKGLQAKKIKKFPFVLTRVVGCGQTKSNSRQLHAGAPNRRQAHRMNPATISVAPFSAFGKQTPRLKMAAKPASAAR
jgi:hypothetical protein